MEEQDYYTSFDEMKNCSLPVEPNSSNSQERRDRFAEAMHQLRAEYQQSTISSQKTSPQAELI